MAHIHDVHNTDERFVIDPVKRTITQKSGKTRLIRGDHNSECYAFEIPRFVDGHDMSTCNSVRIGYINVASDRTQGESKGPYEVKDLIVDPDNDTSVMFSWLLSRNTTKYAGTLNFSITFRCLSDSSVVDYEWSTDTFKGITVSDKIDVDGTEIVEDNVDILEQWRDELTNASNIESVRYTAQELNLDQQAQARENIGAADLDSLIEVFEDIDELRANTGGKTVIGVIDSHYYNFRFLNEERGATMAEIREAAQSKDKDIVIRLDLDNWQGTLQYLGLVNLTDDGSTYKQALLFSTIKMNNGVINTSDNIVSGTVQLEYWYTLLDPGDDMPPVAFVNCQFAEINLAPGASHAGSFMRVNEDGLWDVEKVDVALKSDIPDAVINPTTASVGQTIVVKTVDENNKPTEWEAVDMSNGGDIPTKISQLENDAGYLTEHQDLTDLIDDSTIGTTTVFSSKEIDSRGKDFYPNFKFMDIDRLLAFPYGVDGGDATFAEDIGVRSLHFYERGTDTLKFRADFAMYSGFGGVTYTYVAQLTQIGQTGGFAWGDKTLFDYIIDATDNELYDIKASRTPGSLNSLNEIDLHDWVGNYIWLGNVICYCWEDAYLEPVAFVTNVNPNQTYYGWSDGIRLAGNKLIAEIAVLHHMVNNGIGIGQPGEPGEQGAKGDTPVKGVDYFTETDKQEIVGMVLDDIESSAQIHTLTDTITGQKYRLSVENGKLTMTEVTE